MCVLENESARESKRESVCEREGVCVYVRERGESVCERERKRVRVRGRKRESSALYLKHLCDTCCL